MAGRFASCMRRARAWLIDYAYLVTLCAMVMVVVGTAIYTQQLREQQAENVAAAAKAPETEGREEPERTPEPSVSPLPTIAPLEVHYMQFSSGRGTVWPVEGAVIRPYDEQASVYWEALGSYRVHTGLDIRGEAGEEVRCAADGVATGVVRDALWGYRVTIAQTDGRTAVYAGLSEAWPAVGESVTRGEAIGRLLERVPCEAELGAHLHMELYRGENAQDPEGMLPER